MVGGLACLPRAYPTFNPPSVMPTENSTTPHAELGRAMRTRRNRLDLSQAAAAHRAGMNPKAFGVLERGKGNPTFTTLLKVARGLDMPPHILVEEATSQSPGIPAADQTDPSISTPSR